MKHRIAAADKYFKHLRDIADEAYGRNYEHQKDMLLDFNRKIEINHVQRSQQKEKGESIPADRCYETQLPQCEDKILEP